MWWFAACRSPEPLPVTWAPSPEIASAGTLAFPADGERAEVRLRVDGEPERMLTATLADGEARATVVGLLPGAEHVVEGWVDGALVAVGDLRGPDAPLAFSAEALDPDEASLDDGYLLVAYTDLDWSGPVLVDGQGRVVWWDVVDPAWTAASPRLSRDGKAVLYPLNDRARDAEDQRLVRVELDGSARSTVSVPLAHHMVEELDDGTFAWMAWDIREVEGLNVLSDRILVGDGVAEPEERLSFFDDRGPVYVPCEHALIPDERLGLEVYEWTHANSLMWVEASDELVVVARLLDAAVGLDRRSGEVLWQLGGRDATVPYDQPDDAFSHGHASEAWDGGLLVFDNGSHHDPPASRVVEYAIDADGASVVWEHPAPDGAFVEFLGDARRLPNDGVLVVWNTLLSIEELGRDGEVRWRATLEPTDRNPTLGRARFVPAL